MQVRQALCGLHGHDDIVRFGPHRLHLECLSCGRRTPGWDVKGRDRWRAAATGRPVARRKAA
jgi:hypothetical protein